MKLKPKITLLDHFAKLTDPRVERTKEHKLIGSDSHVVKESAIAKMIGTYVSNN